MLFGSNGSGAARLRSFAGVLWLCVTLGMALMGLLSAGCGGGGDDDGGDDGSNLTTVVSGRVQEYNAATAIVGATVTYNGRTTTTDATGFFRFEDRGTFPAGNLVVTGPANPGYYSFGRYGNANFSVAAGIPVPEVPAGTVRNLGTISLYGRDFPPPPPTF